MLLTGSLCSFSVGSSLVSSPQLDAVFSQNLTTKQLLKRLYLTRKLLALKKLALRNQAMAVNLETLLPQAFPHTAPPLVPSNSGGEEALFGGDVFSPASMYGSDAMSLLPGSDPLDFDPSLLKSDEYLELCGSQYVETLYRTSDSNGKCKAWDCVHEQGLYLQRPFTRRVCFTSRA